MKVYVISEGTVVGVLGERRLPDISGIGRDWIVVEGISETDALYQASLYDSGKHRNQKKLEKVFAEAAQLDDETSVVKLLLDKLYPSPPPPGSVSIKLEAIGDNATGNTLFGASRPSRAWVAEIVEKDPRWKFKREFLKGNKDYFDANSVGSRSVYLHYCLSPGRVYEISDPQSWRKTVRYFCRVEDGRLIQMSEEEVLQWLNEHSG